MFGTVYFGQTYFAGVDFSATPPPVVISGGAGGGPAKRHKGHVKPKHIYPEKKLTYGDLLPKPVTPPVKEIIHPKTLVVKRIANPVDMTEDEEFLMIMNELDML